MKLLICAENHTHYLVQQPFKCKLKHVRILRTYCMYGSDMVMDSESEAVQDRSSCCCLINLNLVWTRIRNMMSLI
jgi:hypothetical protein